MPMAELGQLLVALDDATWSLIANAMAGNATLDDVGAAAAAVHVVAALRRRYSVMTAADQHFKNEFLAGLCARLMELDSGDDLAPAAVVASILKKAREER